MKRYKGALALLAALSGFACGDTGAPGEEARELGVSARRLEGSRCVVLERGQATVEDTQLASMQPGHNFGRLPTAQVGRAGQHLRQALLRFDTSAVPSTATVTSATLTLWQEDARRPGAMEVHAVTSGWAENGVSWDSFGSGYASRVAAQMQGLGEGRPGPLTAQLPGLVATWVRHPSLNQGLLLHQPEGHSTLATSEASNPTHRPRLKVCYDLPDASPTTTSVLLEVLDSSGAPLPTVAAVSSGGALFPTDGSGHLLLENLPTGNFVARIEAPGFAPATHSLELPEGVHAGAEVRLLPLGEPLPFNASKGATLERGPVRVTLPPNAVVDAEGRPVSGTVEATLVPLDPTTTSHSALPGPLEGLTEGATAPVSLESFMMAEVSLWRDGMPLKLAPGAKATLELLLPESVSSRFQPGESIDAWWLDLDAGVWRQEGAGTLQPSASQPGRLVWVTQVSHFTWWNADKTLDTSCLDVLVQDANGLRIPFVRVGAYGINYSGLSRARYTDGQGRACVEVKRGGQVRVYAAAPDGRFDEVVVTSPAGPALCGGGCSPVTLTVPARICTPGDSVVCPYSGRQEDLGQGLCQAGRRWCDVTGTQWSPCRGEILSQPNESCDRYHFDEDCDGQANEGCDPVPPRNEPPWSKAFGSGSNEEGVVVADAGQGDVIVAGVFSGTLVVGDSALTSPGLGSVFVARLDATGNVRWFKRVMDLMPDEYSQFSQLTVQDIALDERGNIFIMGLSAGPLENSCPSLMRTGDYKPTDGMSPDVYVMKLDSLADSCFWKKQTGASMYGVDAELAVTPQGDAFVAVNYWLGIDTLELVRFGANADGQGDWSSSVAGGYIDSIALSVNKSGEPLLGFSFGALYYAPFEIDPWPYVAKGSEDSFLMKYDGQGAPRWQHLLGNAGSRNVIELVHEDEQGDILLAGTFSGSIDLGGSTLSSSTGGLFLAKLDMNRQHIWSRSVEGSVSPRWLDADGNGNVGIAGSFRGSVNFGLTPLEGAAGNVFAAKYDQAGQPLASVMPPLAKAGVTALDFALSGTDSLLFSGTFTQDVSFFGEPSLVNQGGTDGFVLKYGFLP